MDNLGVRDLHVAVMVQFIFKSVVNWFGLDRQKLLNTRTDCTVTSKLVLKKGTGKVKKKVWKRKDEFHGNLTV
jgi:hypothetical protein